MVTIATICARGGSVELPQKNIRSMCGRPLIVHTIKQALHSPYIDHVFVSTDCHKIAKIANGAGAEVPFIRPSNLSTSEVGKHEVVMHCVDQVINMGIHVDKIIDMQPTTPLRSLLDIEASLQLLVDHVDVVFTVKEAKENPYFTLVEKNNNGKIVLSKSLGNDVLSRQQTPKVYALNGSIYAWHLHSLEKGLWRGNAAMHVMPPDRSIDIDSLLDFQIAEYLMNLRSENEANTLS